MRYLEETKHPILSAALNELYDEREPYNTKGLRKKNSLRKQGFDFHQFTS